MRSISFFVTNQVCNCSFFYRPCLPLPISLVVLSISIHSAFFLCVLVFIFYKGAYRIVCLKLGSMGPLDRWKDFGGSTDQQVDWLNLTNLSITWILFITLSVFVLFFFFFLVISMDLQKPCLQLEILFVNRCNSKYRLVLVVQFARNQWEINVNWEQTRLFLGRVLFLFIHPCV